MTSPDRKRNRSPSRVGSRSRGSRSRGSRSRSQHGSRSRSGSTRNRRPRLMSKSPKLSPGTFSKRFDPLQSFVFQTNTNSLISAFAGVGLSKEPQIIYRISSNYFPKNLCSNREAQICEFTRVKKYGFVDPMWDDEDGNFIG